MLTDTRTWFVAICCLVAAVPLLAGPSPLPATGSFPGWPTTFDGRALTPLPLTALEQRFAQDFPGRIGRFTDGRRELVIRWVTRETRQLHPAVDCFKGSGFRIVPQPIEVETSGIAWGRFVATRGTAKLSVRERIYDMDGNSWTDVSAWYWSALRSQSRGPWWAVTIAETQPATPRI